ncbi:MAG TPA: HlyD family efflux transporter periplasmic adaptor subunit [Xanthobacteraceae bacterium]|nr:HlyD family efflux transporter periplasmic adaptor subunit [Xanthobacteraceae bacterium]
MQNRARATPSDDGCPSGTEEDTRVGSRGRETGLDARALRRALEHGIEEGLSSRASPAGEDKPGETSPAKSGRAWRRTAKTLVGIAVVAVFGWIPLQALLQTSSVEAVVNSRVVTLRSPIDGEVVAGRTSLSDSGVIRRGAVVLRVVNPRAERARLDDLRRQLARLESELPAIKAKLAAARALEGDLTRQAAQFREWRIRQLEARIAELESLVAAAVARREEAAAAVERATSLVRSNSISTAELARLTRERTIAEQTEVGARRRLDATQIELKAAHAGTFLGDSYNDRPSSMQRQEELHQQVATLSAALDKADADIAWLRGEIAQEQVRYSTRSAAEIRLPVAGRLWEMMTSPGEDVRAGQPLLRVLDCSGAVVTANVTERVYNRLQVGSPARFVPAEGGPEFDGVISNLTGAAGAAANLAISPDSLGKEPYRVTVSIPQLARESADCKVGRTGRVIFAGEKAATP